jgi:hypothetical protein
MANLCTQSSSMRRYESQAMSKEEILRVVDTEMRVSNAHHFPVLKAIPTRFRDVALLYF